MKNKLFTFIIVLFMANLILSACTLPSVTSGGLRAYLETPVTGQVFPTGAAILLRGSGIHDNVGRQEDAVKQIIFYANGLKIGEARNFPWGNTYSSGSIEWTPPEPGEYILQVEVIRNNGGAISAPAKICVIDASFGALVYSNGFTGPCATPTRNPSASGNTAPSINLSVDPLNVGFNNVNCSPSTEIRPINFRATVVDPSDRVAFVVVELSPGISRYMLNYSSNPQPNRKLFIGDSGEYLGTLTGNRAITINWTAKAIGRDGRVLATQTGTITARPCTAPAGKPDEEEISSPEPTGDSTIAPTLEITATNTPASAKDCPSGTYFSEYTFQCIQVGAIPTLTAINGNDGGSNSCQDPGTCPYGWSQENCACK